MAFRQPDQPVYLVDQDEVVRDSLKVLLESHGFIVCDFADASAFLRSGRHAGGGCLVLGCNRNIVVGLELTDALKRLGSAMPVIFVVGGGGPAARAMVQAAGAFAYLERPAQEATLIKIVREALARSAVDARRDVAPASAAHG
jgi:FixJ family two-component response regulator